MEHLQRWKVGFYAPKYKYIYLDSNQTTVQKNLYEIPYECDKRIYLTSLKYHWHGDNSFSIKSK